MTEKDEIKEEKKDDKKEEKPRPVDKLVESKHSVTIGGRELKYTVLTGTIVMKEETPDREKEFEAEKPRAQIFFIAYTKDDTDDKSKRPITFSFNGGPGSSSAWLHLGLLGPQPGRTRARRMVPAEILRCPAAPDERAHIACRDERAGPEPRAHHEARTEEHEKVGTLSARPVEHSVH